MAVNLASFGRWTCQSCAFVSRLALRSGGTSRPPNGPAAGVHGSRRKARSEPAAAPDSRCTTSGCSAPAGEPRGR